MDTLVNDTQLREMFFVGKDLVATRTNPAINAASRRLRRWVGESVYTDALSNTPADEARQEDLTYAEAHLAMHFVLLGFNTQIGNRGVVKTEQAQPGVIITYLVPSEIRQLTTMYLEQAEEIAGPYLLVDSLSQSDAMAVE